MSTYTIQIYLAGLLAFAANENPGGRVESVTVLVPAQDSEHERHIPFVLWPDGTVEKDGCGQAEDILSGLDTSSAPVPSGWGGCILNSEEISLSPIEDEWSPFRLDYCLMGPAPLSQFCWVPVMGQLGDSALGQVDSKYLTDKLAATGLQARFKIENGHLMTYHLAERGGRVPAFSFPPHPPGALTVQRVMGDIAVLEVKVEAERSVSLYLRGSSGEPRVIPIKAGGAGESRRILIGNMAPKEKPQDGPEPTSEVVTHFARLYDLVPNPPTGARRVPIREKTDPGWDSEVFGNPEYCAMPEPLRGLYERFNESCKGFPGKKTPFQKPACPMATFTVAGH